MGFFDIFKKKRRTLLDQFNDIVDKGSQNTNTPLMCYKMAYVVLPQELRQNPTATLDRIRSQADSAGVLFYTKACMSSGCIPKREDAAAFRTHMGRLSPNQAYFIIEYPSPPPPRFDTAVPVLAPYFSAAIVNETNGQPAYFVLGQAPSGGTTLRTVEDGVNANMGPGSEPTLDAFLQLLRSIVKDKSTFNRPVEQIDRLNAINKIIRNEEKIPDVAKGEKPKDRFLVEGKDKIEHKKPEGITYKKGDFIGQKYEVHDVLGMGGLGIVYLVYSHETKDVYALKTFRDEFIEDKQVRERFRKEAQVWIDLDRHPYLVRAYFVDEISGRLFIAMEYIASDQRGLSSLDDYLKRRPPDLAQTLRWAIQFCYGMEYAYSKGIRAHRDIKPANILIGQDKAVKISDFGLAGVVGASKAISGAKLDIQKDKCAYQTVEGIALGTPPYMAPEQFLNAAACDEGSDIYSFGVVLYQMVTGGNLPFSPEMAGNTSPEMVFQSWYLLHSKAPIPKLNSALYPVIQGCLSKEKQKRYASFVELRKDLEPLLKSIASEIIIPTGFKELEAWEWNNKGISLCRLHFFEEAIRCFEKTLELDDKQDMAWSNKGNIFLLIGNLEEAIRCCDKALQLNASNVNAWINKVNIFINMGCFDEAFYCCDKALDFNGKDATAWLNKGIIHLNLGHFDQAIYFFDQALHFDPRDTAAWNNKGISLEYLGFFEEAIVCFDKTLEINLRDGSAWNNKGNNLHHLNRLEEAVSCYDKALEFDQQDTRAWNNKGNTLISMGRFEEGMACYDKALEIDPRSSSAMFNKGYSLYQKSYFERAIHCFNEAINFSPQDARAWHFKGLCLYKLNLFNDATAFFDKTIELDPHDPDVGNDKRLCLESIDRLEEAIRLDSKGVEIALHDLSSLMNKGLAFYKNGLLSQAIYCFDKVLRQSPKDVNALYNKGLSLYGLNLIENAVECFDIIFELNPQYANAWITKGLSLRRLGRFEEAILSLDKALEINPRDENTWYSKGQSLDSLNRLGEAVHCFEKALEINPQYVIACYAKALVQEKQKKYKYAAESYKQFISQAPLQGMQEIYAKQIEYASKRLDEMGKKKA